MIDEQRILLAGSERADRKASRQNLPRAGGREGA